MNNYFNNMASKKDSTLSVIAAVLCIFLFTAPIGMIIGLIDLGIGNKYERHLGSYFSIIAGLVVIFFLTNNDTSSNNNNNNGYKNNNAITTTEKPTEKATTNTYDLTNVDDLPQTVVINGLEIKINNYNLEYENDNIFYELKDNEKYISLTISYKNTNKNDIYVSIYDFTCYADNILCEQAFIIDNNFINGNLSYNRQINFDVAFIMPIDSESIEIEYKDMFNDNNAIFKLK